MDIDSSLFKNIEEVVREQRTYSVKSKERWMDVNPCFWELRVAHQIGNTLTENKQRRWGHCRGCRMLSGKCLTRAECFCAFIGNMLHERHTKVHACTASVLSRPALCWVLQPVLDRCLVSGSTWRSAGAPGALLSLPSLWLMCSLSLILNCEIYPA